MLEQVKKNYDALADMRENIVTIDGEQSEEDVLAAVKRVLAENLDDQNF
jgi:thymidylate kinase